MDPKVNFLSLGLKLTSPASTIDYLQDKCILPRKQQCGNCKSTMVQLSSNGSGYFFHLCPECRHKQSVRTGTILAGVSIPLRSFVLLVYILTMMTSLTYNQSKTFRLFNNVQITLIHLLYRIISFIHLNESDCCLLLF